METELKNLKLRVCRKCKLSSEINVTSNLSFSTLERRKCPQHVIMPPIDKLIYMNYHFLVAIRRETKKSICISIGYS